MQWFALSPYSKKVVRLISSLEIFVTKFACSICIGAGSLRALQLPLTVQ